jgi:hypothetical protein
MSMGEVWYGTKLNSAVVGNESGPIFTISKDDFGVDGDLPQICAAAHLNGAWTATGVNGEYKIALTTQTYVVFVGDVELTAGTPGALPDNGFGWSLNELYVKIGENPSGLSVQAATNNALDSDLSYREYHDIDFRYSNSTSAGTAYTGAACSGMVLDGCRVSRGREYSTRLYAATNPVIRGCTLTGRVKAAANKPVLYISNGGSGFVMEDNTITGNSSNYGILDSVGGAAIRRNIFNSGANGVRLTGPASTVEDNSFTGDIDVGVAIVSSSGHIVRGNTLSVWNGLEYGAGGGCLGISLDGSSANNKITGNIFTECYTDINLSETSGLGNNLVALNVFNRPHVNSVQIGTAAAVTATDRVINNVFVCNPYNGIGHSVVIASAATRGIECGKACVKNNLFIGEYAGAEMISFDAGLAAYPAGMSVFDVDYNTYWQRDTGASWRLSDAGGDITSFADWKTALATAGVTGADAHSLNVVGASTSVVVDHDADNFRLTADSLCKNAGIVLFVDGDGDQYDADGYQVWDDTYNIPDGHWIDGVDIGAYAYGGNGKYYTQLTIVSGTSPADWVVKMPAAPDIITLLGVDSAWYDASGVPKEINFTDVGNDVKIYDGAKGRIVLYSIDMSAEATRIHRIIGD